MYSSSHRFAVRSTSVTPPAIAASTRKILCCDMSHGCPLRRPRCTPLSTTSGRLDDVPLASPHQLPANNQGNEQSPNLFRGASLDIAWPRPQVPPWLRALLLHCPRRSRNASKTTHRVPNGVSDIQQRRGRRPRYSEAVVFRACSQVEELRLSPTQNITSNSHN